MPPPASPPATADGGADADADADFMAELLAMNQNQSLVQEDDVAFITRSARTRLWNLFRHYCDFLLEQGETLPGGASGADEYLNADGPVPDFKICSGFFYDWATGTSGRVSDKPARYTADIMWAHIRAQIRECRGQDFPKQLGLDILVELKNMVIQGILTAERRRRTFTDENGMKAVIDVVWSAAFPLRHTRQRMQFTLWAGITKQRAQRVGSHFPNACDSPDRPGMTYQCFTINVLAAIDGATSNRITVTYLAPNAKNDESDKEVVLEQTEELWACPIFAFLCLATQDSAMPFSWAQILDPAILRGHTQLHLDMLQPSKSVCVPLNLNGTGQRGSWTTNGVRNALGQASALLGFEQALTPHGYRRTAALLLQASGHRLEQIRQQLTHRFSSSVTRVYTKQGVPADVAAMQHNQSSRLVSVFGLHRDSMRREAGVPKWLDQAAINSVYEREDVSEATERHDRLRNKIMKDHGSVSSAVVPKDELAALKQSYDACQKLQRPLYEAEMAKAVAAYHRSIGISDDTSPSTGDPDGVNALPENGETIDYDARAFEQVVCNMGIAEIIEPNRSNAPTTATVTPAPNSTQSNSCSIFHQRLLSETGDSIDRQAMLDLYLSLPARYSCVAGFRPGHEPVAGDCPSCHTSLETLCNVDVSSIKLASKQQDVKNDAWRRHINGCYADAARDEALPGMLQKYQSRINAAQFPIKIDFGSEEVNCWVASRLLRATIKDSDVTCLVCDIDLTGIATARAHLLVSHGIWLPEYPGHGKVGSRLLPVENRLENGAWDLETSRLPTATYFSRIGRYIADPQEVETVSADLHQRSFGSSGEAYGVHGRNLVLPQHITAKDDPKIACDTRYELILDKKGGVEQSGLCFFCVNDPGLPMCIRMQEQDDKQALKLHSSRHLRLGLQRAERYIAEYNRPGEAHEVPERAVRDSWAESDHAILVDDQARYVCPDPSCVARDRTATTDIELIQHLVACHGLSLYGPDTGRKLPIPLHELCPSSKTSLAAWCKQKKSADPDKKKPGTKDNGVSQAGKKSGSAAKGKAKAVVNSESSEEDVAVKMSKSAAKGKAKRVIESDSSDDDGEIGGDVTGTSAQADASIAGPSTFKSASHGADSASGSGGDGRANKKRKSA